MRALAVLLALLLGTVAHAAPVLPQVMDHGRFQGLHVYRPAGAPKSFSLLLSGDGGWAEAQMDAMAQVLVAQGALVAGIDTQQMLAFLEADGGDCAYAVGDLENLAHFVQAWAKLPGYLPPVLTGFSSGATLAYGQLVQAKPGTFAAGLGLGFCPDLPLKKPLCAGEGLRFKPRKDGQGVDLLPAPKLATPFVALLGEQDSYCAAKPTQAFIDQIPVARQVLLPQVAHDYGDHGRGRAALAAAYRKLAQVPTVVATPADLGELPVIEDHADSDQGGSGDGGRFAVLWSGDGGWAGLDKDVAEALRTRGISVVGVDSLRYFWTARTPAGIGADLDRIIRHYSAAWGKREVILIGYSQGADVLPFAINHLSETTRKQVLLAAAIGLSDHAVFEFQLSNWVADNNNGPATLPEVRKLRTPFLCIYGEEEEDSICPQLTGSRVTVAKLPGGHHFDGDYGSLAETILKALPKP
ncbi:MAG: AcvB/VirJ family lysyl-phosphatidylglycerol hydrolase [Stagnimonas sp.]|nr:AcvB/VirJ family lysyl-phosphatidylglycerol hydrolase [Stagnimonas sp.]